MTSLWLSSIRILVIDDDREIRGWLKGLFEYEGCSVIEAANGEIGLNVYRQLCPDVVITDINMPVMNGLETIAALRRDYPAARTIAMSGDGSMGDDDNLDLACKAGAHVIMRKPLNAQKVVCAVRYLTGTFNWLR